MITSLAEKLGPKNRLLAFSVHPSTVEGNALGVYCNWDVDYPLLSKSFHTPKLKRRADFSQWLLIKLLEIPRGGTPLLISSRNNVVSQPMFTPPLIQV